MGFIDWIVLLSIGAVVVGIAVYLIVRKKKNKGGCGCGCSDCPHAGACCSSAEKKTKMKNKKDEAYACMPRLSYTLYKADQPFFFSARFVCFCAFRSSFFLRRK